MRRSTTRRAGRFVPDSEPVDKVAELLVHGVQRLWCWREITVPMAAAVACYCAHRPGPAGALAAGFVLGAGLLGLIWPGTVAGVFRRCRARSRALSTQIAWPRVCERLGWSRRLPSGGRLVPWLLGWEADTEHVRVVVRPLPEQGVAAWDHMADALRRLIDGQSVQWREQRGELTVQVSRYGLPSKLRWGCGLSSSERIVIGERHDGTVLALDVLRAPHVLLAGATGSGKGAAIRAMLAGALEAGWQAVVLDPKESGEYRWLERLGVPVFAALSDQAGALEALETRRRRRQALIKRHGMDAWRELPADARASWRPILVVVDEAADLLVPVKGRSQDQRDLGARQQHAAALVGELVRKGRSAGIHVLVAIQRPDTAQLGDGGGALRNNLTARLALASLDAEGVRMMGIPSGDPIATTLDGTPGRGICVGFGDDPRPGACQVAWLDQQQATAQVRPSAPQGLASIAPVADERDATALTEAEPV